MPENFDTLVSNTMTNIVRGICLHVVCNTENYISANAKNLSQVQHRDITTQTLTTNFVFRERKYSMQVCIEYDATTEDPGACVNAGCLIEDVTDPEDVETIVSVIFQKIKLNHTEGRIPVVIGDVMCDRDKDGWTH